eukprot:ANDGO_08482.mRNA.1 hypothetical protein
MHVLCLVRGGPNARETYEHIRKWVFACRGHTMHPTRQECEVFSCIADPALNAHAPLHTHLYIMPRLRCRPSTSTDGSQGLADDSSAHVSSATAGTSATAVPSLLDALLSDPSDEIARSKSLAIVSWDQPPAATAGAAPGASSSSSASSSASAATTGHAGLSTPQPSRGISVSYVSSDFRELVSKMSHFQVRQKFVFAGEYLLLPATPFLGGRTGPSKGLVLAAPSAVTSAADFQYATNAMNGGKNGNGDEDVAATKMFGIRISLIHVGQRIATAVAVEIHVIDTSADGKQTSPNSVPARAAEGQFLNVVMQEVVGSLNAFCEHRKCDIVQNEQSVEASYVRAFRANTN